MEISQEDTILIKKSLYLSKRCGARRLLSEMPDKGRELGSTDNLLKTIRKTGNEFLSVARPTERGGGSRGKCPGARGS